MAFNLAYAFLFMLLWGANVMTYAICILVLAFICYLCSFIARGESLKVRISIGIAFGFLTVSCIAQVIVNFTGGSL